MKVEVGTRLLFFFFFHLNDHGQPDKNKGREEKSERRKAYITHKLSVRQLRTYMIEGQGGQMDEGKTGVCVCVSFLNLSKPHFS